MKTTMIILADEGDRLDDALRIRREVFVDEKALFAGSDLDKRERGALHLVYYLDEEPAGTVRMSDEGGGRWTGSRLAVLPKYRAAGVGAALITAAEAVVAARGCTGFDALIREPCVSLFEKQGWEDFGDGGVVAGEPHRSMRSSLPRRRTLFTVGYQRHTPESLVEMLREAGVRILFDVRQRASSRKKGFSKTALQQVLETAGIEYAHLPRAGSPPDVRKDFITTGDRKVFTSRYLSHIAEVPQVLDEAASLLDDGPACLMCLEADPIGCHRLLFADELIKKVPDLVIVHL
jgi:putative N-acetyltransferase (TIGR04045 family)